MSLVHPDRYPQTIIHQLDVTTDDTSLGQCVHHMIERASEAYHNKIAVKCCHIEFTFGELNALANCLARALIERGIRPGDLVCFALDRSAYLVVVLLGILKAGAAYVPIDPSFPAERIGYMLDDAKPRLMILEARTRDILSFWKGDHFMVEKIRGSADNVNANLQVNVGLEDLA